MSFWTTRTFLETNEMARISEEYTGAYFKSSDIPEGGVEVTIAGTAKAKVDGKLVLEFQDDEHSLVLNKTNAVFLASQLGDETDTWVGAVVELVVERVPFMGKMTDGIRCKRAGRVAPPTTKPKK